MMEAVDTYIRARFKYLGENIETLLTPDYMLSGLEMNGYLTGDCDDIATLQSAILTCLDIKTRFTAIKSKNHQEYDHVFLEAWSGNEWQIYDATVPKDTEYFMLGRVSIEV